MEPLSTDAGTGAFSAGKMRCLQTGHPGDRLDQTRIQVRQNECAHGVTHALVSLMVSIQIAHEQEAVCDMGDFIIQEKNLYILFNYMKIHYLS